MNLTAQAIINKTGEITINIDNETIISSSRLKTILIPLNGDSYKGTTGTPFISSVRDCNILNVKISGINRTEHVVSDNSLTTF